MDVAKSNCALQRRVTMLTWELLAVVWLWRMIRAKHNGIDDKILSPAYADYRRITLFIAPKNRAKSKLSDIKPCGTLEMKKAQKTTWEYTNKIRVSEFTEKILESG